MGQTVIFCVLHRHRIVLGLVLWSINLKEISKWTKKIAKFSYDVNTVKSLFGGTVSKYPCMGGYLI